MNDNTFVSHPKTEATYPKATAEYKWWIFKDEVNTSMN